MQKIPDLLKNSFFLTQGIVVPKSNHLGHIALFSQDNEQPS
jgi:hypothetical protein